MIGSEDYRMPECHCPYCGKKISAASNAIDEGEPKVGDVTICLYCGEVAMFDADLHLREPTADETIAIARDGRTDQLRKMWLMWQAEQAKGQ